MEIEKNRVYTTQETFEILEHYELAHSIQMVQALLRKGYISVEKYRKKKDGFKVQSADLLEYVEKHSVKYWRDKYYALYAEHRQNDSKHTDNVSKPVEQVEENLLGSYSDEETSFLEGLSKSMLREIYCRNNGNEDDLKKKITKQELINALYRIGYKPL